MLIMKVKKKKSVDYIMNTIESGFQLVTIYINFTKTFDWFHWYFSELTKELCEWKIEKRVSSCLFALYQ